MGTARDGVVNVDTGEDTCFEDGVMLAAFFLGVPLGDILGVDSLTGRGCNVDLAFCIGAETVVSVGLLYVSVARRD